MRSLRVMAVLLAGMAGRSPAQPPAPASCGLPEQRQFDFWIGEWEVVEFQHPDSVVASARIEPILGACALRESYQGRNGLTGQSLSSYDGTRRVWHQSWVTNRGQLLLIEGRMDGGRMLLSGAYPGTAAKSGRIRGIWQPVNGGVRETAETSADDGKTWRPLFDLLFRKPVASPPARVDTTTYRPQPPDGRDPQRDFDFEIGSWNTHLSRRLRPLTGSNTWVEYDGTTEVRKVWSGRANLVELVVDGPAGHIEALSLRLYNPESRQWSLNFSNSAGGTLSEASIGGFKNGRGEFYDQETLNGRAILVRFVIHDITPTSCRFEQAFSDDGGKTWEVNWIATDTRRGP